MQAHRHTLPPLPTNLSLPPRPDISTFSFSQIGGPPSLLQRFGPRTSTAATTANKNEASPPDIALTQENVQKVARGTPSEDEKESTAKDDGVDPIMKSKKPPGQSEIIAQEPEVGSIGHNISFNPDIWADAARVQQEWASVERQDGDPTSHSESLSSSLLSLATPRQTAHTEHSQTKLAETAHANGIVRPSDDISTQDDHRTVDSMKGSFVPVKTTQDVNLLIPTSKARVNYENHRDSTVPVAPEVIPESESVSHSAASSSYSTLQTLSATTPAFIPSPFLPSTSRQEQHSAQDHAPSLGVIKSQDIAPTLNQNIKKESLSVSPRVAGTSLQAPNHIASLASHDLSTAPGPVSAKTSQNLRHREIVSDTPMMDFDKAGHIQKPTSQTHILSNSKMAAPSRGTQVKKAAQELPSGIKRSTLNKQIPPQVTAGRVSGPHSFVREGNPHWRSSGDLPSDRSGPTSRFERREYIRRSYPESQYRRSRSPPRASLRHDENRFRPRSRSPSPSRYYSRSYNTRSTSPRSPRSPYSRPMHNRTPSPPRRRRSPQRSSRLHEPSPSFYTPNPERPRNGHYSPPRRGPSSLPPRPEVSSNGPDYAAYRSSIDTPNSERRPQGVISNIAESNKVGTMQTPIVSVSTGRKPKSTETEAKVISSKRNRDDPELLQPDNSASKRRRLEDDDNDINLGVPTLASRLDPRQHGNLQKMSLTTTPPGSPQSRQLLQRLSNNLGQIDAVKSSDEAPMTSRRVSSHINETHGLYAVDRTEAPSLASRFALSASPLFVRPDANDTVSPTPLADRLRAGHADNMSTRTQSQSESNGQLIDRLRDTQSHEGVTHSHPKETGQGPNSLRERLK